MGNFFSSIGSTKNINNNISPSQASERMGQLISIYFRGNKLSIENFTNEFTQLIKYGADVNLESIHGLTPLHAACYNGKLEVAQLLIKNGADVNHAGHNGNSPLCVVCDNNQTDLVELLINNGANVNQANDLVGDTPLYWACQNGDTDLVKLLINNGANVNQESYLGGTPLYWACKKGYFDIVELLINNGANVDTSILKSMVQQEDSVYIDELVNDSSIEGLRESKEVTVHLRNGIGQEILDILHLPQEFENHIHVIGQNGAEMTLHFAAYPPILK
ncbi:MAG: ankyrin repeat domain-containing protein [Rickettsiaceae bacterium]|nr:ankyrin repeat domain-containing protein [Rickettsiaceae bacterium]